MRFLSIIGILLLAPALVQGADVVGFTLIDAASDSAIRSLVDGDTIDLATVGSSLNVRADVDGSVGSVSFTLSGAQSRSHTESAAPYALFGDSSGDYNVWSPALGTYTLSASADDGVVHSIDFSVVSEGSDPDPDPNADDGDGSITITGERKRWHKVSLELQGPWASETGSPNPFLDYRMTVVFSNGSLSYTVPGYFAADGDAANSSASSGTVWRAHLRPDETGTWNYQVSFTAGAAVAVNGGGSAVAPYDGLSGSFTVSETDKSAPDLRARGRLEYIGEHYLKFAGRTNAGDGDWFLKQGADSPETMFAYQDFDGPFKTDGHGDHLIKSWSPHLGDWNSGDPTWQNGKGKGLIGAINYLASEGMNAFSFLTMNINGDGKNVFPYLNYNERYRMDVSRLEQWAIIMAHGESRGMYLHFKTQETENDQLLDGGALGTQRKLYYRELIARFGHHLALNWNLGEENTNTDAQRKQFAQYFWDNDPYRHNIVVHTYPGQKDAVYTPLLGDASRLTGTSIQTSATNLGDVHAPVRQWVQASRDAGKKWVVAVDEPGSATYGVAPDGHSIDPGHDDARSNALWGTFMAGGAGNEWYFGWSGSDTDLNSEDFRSRDQWWDQCRYALEFFHNNDVPFWLMDNDNSLSSASSDYVFADIGQVYVVYLKNGGSTNLDLSGVSGSFSVRWFDPRNGGSLQNGSVTSVNGGGSRSLGNAPNNTSKDWAILVTLSDGNPPPPSNEAPTAVISSSATSGEAPVTINFDGNSSSDSDGSIVSYAWNFGDGSSVSGAQVSHSFTTAGSYVVTLTVTDDDGASDNSTVTISVSETDPPPSEQQSFGNNGQPWQIAASGTTRIEAENYDAGGAGVAYQDSSSGNSGGAYRQDDVDIEACSDTGGGFNVGWIASNEWLEYSIDVAAAGNYEVAIRFARPSLDDNALHFELDGSPIGSNVRLGVTGAWQSWSTATTVLNLPAGEHVLRLVTDSSKFNLNYLAFSPQQSNQAPVAQASVSPDNGTAPLSVQFTGDQSQDSDGSITAYTWDFGDGHTASTANPSHIYDEAGTYTAVLTVTDNDGASDSDQVTIVVDDAQLPGDVVLAINSGGAAYTAIDGTQYQADQHFSNGQTFKTSASIGGTEDDFIYQSERYAGNLQYDIPLTNGDYLLTLQFAEVYFTASGKRVFDIIVEDVNEQQALDLYAVTGNRYIAYDVQIPVQVSDGVLNIDLPASVNNGKLAALRIETIASGSEVVTAINVGGAVYTAEDGTLYTADQHFNNGKTYTRTSAIANTLDDTLYQSERYAANLSYAVPVTNGDYLLTLQFAEIYFTADGQRVFDVLVEGSTVTSDLDLHAVTGGRYIAHDLAVPVTVSDGVLDIACPAVVDNGKLSAIRLESTPSGMQ